MFCGLLGGMGVLVVLPVVVCSGVVQVASEIWFVLVCVLGVSLVFFLLLVLWLGCALLCAGR